MQSAINMHTSQISHGLVEAADFVNDGANPVVCGYTPSMIKVTLVTDGLDPIAIYHWYDWMPDNLFTGVGLVDSFLAVTENGFIVAGDDAVALEGTAAAFVWETYGCKNDDYRHVMNPDAVAADGAMDFVQPVVDPTAVDEDEYEYSELL